jgi:hypothetical protein
LERWSEGPAEKRADHGARERDTRE